MSAIFKTQGGGGFFPSIFVTVLSEVNAVYASKDGRTVHGKWDSERNGFRISPLRELGLWTVTVTNGVKTATEEVLVDVATEFEIEMGFYTYLYKQGDECEEITGGWSYTRPSNYSGKSSLTKNENDMLLHVDNANYYGCMYHEKAIDLTSYTKLHTEGNFVFGNSTEGTVAYIVFASTEKANSSNVNAVGAFERPNNMPTTEPVPENVTAHPTNYIQVQNKSFDVIEFDVSGLTGSYYMWFLGHRGVLELTYENIWLV